MTDLAEAIDWKYGPVADCNLDTGTITVWRHPTLPQPDAAQIVADIAEYQVVKADVLVARAIEADRFARFLFEVHYDAESRLRALEGKPPITKQQYRDALVAVWKGSL